MSRLPVRKTYKLYIGGEFPRSESGRSYRVDSPSGETLAWAAKASRKDLRDAVRAARAAFPGWAARTAYNRAQILYRVAEIMEGRFRQFMAEVAASGVGLAEAEAEVATAIDRWVWYAGWADKIAHVWGTVDPVAGPFFTFSVPEPTGVVGLAAPEAPSLVGLVSQLAPALVGGNTVVALASERWPLPAVALAEALATSDVPGGVVNLLTGSKTEVLPWLAGHMDVNAFAFDGAPPDLVASLEAAAAETVARVVHQDLSQETPWAVTAFLETKTVWHPTGI